MGEWVKASKTEAAEARDQGGHVKFTAEGWFVERVDTSDLTSKAAEVFEDMRGPLAKTKGGQYVPNYKKCDCGEMYVVEDEHKKYSDRHKKWSKGFTELDEIETAYPVNHPTPRLEVGVNKVCERCKARNKKGEDFYPDPSSRPENRYPCRLCNGHGVRPNVV